MPRIKFWILFLETYGFSASFPSLPSPPGLLFVRASQGEWTSLTKGWFLSGTHLALANGCGRSESTSSQWGQEALNSFAYFSQHFSLRLREDCAPGSCCHFTPTLEKIHGAELSCCLLLLLSRFSRVRLCATPEMAAHQAPPSLGFSRQEHWSGLPFPSPMHEREKWKWSCSVVSDS